MVSRDDLKVLLSDIRATRIAVIGDFCVDAYWFMDESASEISVETHRPTRPVRRQRYSLGGAGNVVKNLLDLGVGQVRVYGVVGADPFAHQMRQLLDDSRVDREDLMTQTSNWDTHVYTKPYIGDKEESRIDFGNFNALSDPVAAEMLDKLEARLGDLDIVVINEQVMLGIHNSPFFRDRLGRLISRHPDRRFILDSRHFSDGYPGAMRKINDREAVRQCGIRCEPGESVPYEAAARAAEAFWARFRHPVFVSRGSRGALVCDGEGVREVPGLLILGRTDTVGAGDSMLAGIAAALASGRDNLTAAALGNLVAGVTVGKLFITGTATPAEIMAIGAGLTGPDNAPAGCGSPPSRLKIERLHDEATQREQAWVRLSPQEAADSEQGVVEVRARLLVPSSNQAGVDIAAFENPPGASGGSAFHVFFHPNGAVKLDEEIEVPSLKLKTDQWQDLLIRADLKRGHFDLAVGEQTTKGLPLAPRVRRIQSLALCPNAPNGTLYVAGIAVRVIP